MAQDHDLLSQRERLFFDGYRLFEAAALVLLTFGPMADRVVDLPSPLIARGVSMAYLLAAVVIFFVGRALKGEARPLVLLGLLIDVFAATAAVLAIDGFESQIASLLLVNVSCGALLMPPRLAFPFALLASVALVGSYSTGVATRDAWTAGSLYALAYLAATVLCQIMRRSMVETRKLAEKREIDLANLSQLNDLIIRRMRTGVIVVDSANQVHRINESAWHLLGNPSPNRKDLGDIAPELSRRLYHWRTSGKSESAPAALAEGVPEVIPRFVRLATESNGDAQNVLIFLDDISLLSRQAEQLTLSSLGRLSASIAHEVRNPLTAISYSAQLLAESEDLPEPDHRLVDIIRLQCSRMNSIVENILQLSRRERSRPESIDLGQFVASFVDEFRNVQPLEKDELRAIATPSRGLVATVDPGQLQQIVWNLVQNALRYGRLPHEPARVSVIARKLADSGPAVVEVVDRGPGIPKRVADQIFDPFFTTHEHGTGLGLYIARQLCEANQATLEYVPVAGGGSCFRIILPVSAPIPIGFAAKQGPRPHHA